MDHTNTPRYQDCLNLYIQHRGRNIKQIEREMRSLGHEDFHRRILYSRTEDGERKPGWIEKYGWYEYLPAARSSAALPPDVRNGSAFPNGFNKNPGGCASAPPRAGGIAAKHLNGSNGKAKPFRTSNGQSPSEPPGGQRLSAAVSNWPPAHAGGSDNSFRAWLKSVSPGMNWDWRHIRYITERLKAVTDGSCKRLMIFLPPRHGKSELVTVRYTAWRLTQDPRMNVILAGYNQQLANRFSRKIKHSLFDAAAVHQAETRPVGSVSAPCNQAEPRPVASVSANGLHEQECSHKSPDKRPDTCSCGQNPKSQIQNPKSEIPYLPANAARPRRINSSAEWETNAGGSLRAVGVGGGVTGFGADLIVIDDPVKSRAEAESETRRRRLWEWYRDDIQTRLEPDGAVILIQTRWHEHDLAGKLLEKMQTGGDRWEVINLPALSEPPASAGGQFPANDRTLSVDEPSSAPPPDVRKGCAFPSSFEECSAAAPPFFGGSEAEPPDPFLKPFGKAEPFRTSGGHSPETADPLGRPPGAALCPERFDENKLADIQRKLGSYAFAALYQQHPTPAEGGIFKRAWFAKFVDKAPAGLKWKRGYDLAVSTKTAACCTASFRCAFDDNGTLYIDGGFRDRIEYPDQRRFIVERVLAEPDTEHGIELALHGQAIMQDLRREPRVRAHLLRGVRIDADKITRALAWAPLAEEGKIALVKGPWNEAFIEEACSFPAGAFDDQIDAVSLAVEMLKKKPRRVFAF